MSFFSPEFFLTIFLSIVPGLIWLNFYLREDSRPEPIVWLALVFFVGMIMTFPAAFFQEKLDLIFHFRELRGDPFANVLYVGLFLFFAAAIEEILKFAAAFFTALQNKKIYNEPVDAMIYLVVAAIGFSTSENLFYSVNSLQANAFHLILAIAFVRFIGATFMHTLSSAFIGYGLAWSTFYKHRAKLFFGFLAAIVLHTFYNFLIILNAWLFALIIFGLFLVGVAVLHEFYILKIKSGQY